MVIASLFLGLEYAACSERNIPLEPFFRHQFPKSTQHYRLALLAPYCEIVLI